MPYADLSAQREYQAKWIASKREKHIEGKRCYFCGSTENLVIHHINKEDKESHRIWSWKNGKIESELLKCEILCDSCHRKIHSLETRKPLIHGTLNAYKQHKCRCDKCRKANAERVAAQRKTSRLKH